MAQLIVGTGGWLLIVALANTHSLSLSLLLSNPLGSLLASELAANVSLEAVFGCSICLDLKRRLLFHCPFFPSLLLRLWFGFALFSMAPVTRKPIAWCRSKPSASFARPKRVHL